MFVEGGMESILGREEESTCGKRGCSAITGNESEPTATVRRMQESTPVDYRRPLRSPKEEESVMCQDHYISGPLPQRPPRIRNRIVEETTETTTGVYSTTNKDNNTRDESIRITPLLQFLIRLDGMERMAIMDSGSQYCLIGERELREISNPHVIKKEVKLRGVGDPSVCTESRRTAILKVSIGDIDYGQYNFIVLEYLKEGVILGMPFLVKNEIKLNVAERTFTRRGDTDIVEQVYLPTEPGDCLRIVTSVPVYVALRTTFVEDVWVPVKVRWSSKQIKPRTGGEWENQRSEELVIENQEITTKRRYNNRFRILPGLVKWRDGQGKVLVKKLTACQTQLVCSVSTTVQELSKQQDTEKEWSEDSFENEIEFMKGLTIEQRRKLVEVLWKSTAAFSRSDSDIRYYPGKENVFADTWSRCHREADDDNEVFDPYTLPKGLSLIRLVPGGADSLFQSLKDVLEKVHLEEYHELKGIREVLTKVLWNREKGEVVKILKSVKNTWKRAIPEVLLAASDRFKVKIWLHHGSCCSIAYIGPRAKGEEENLRDVHLQVLGGRHFNRVKDDGTFNSTNRNVIVGEIPYNVDDRDKEIFEDRRNTSLEHSHEESFVDEEFDLLMGNSSEGLEINMLMKERGHNSRLSCNHILRGVAWKEVQIGEVTKFAFLDTGSVIRLVQESVVRDLTYFGQILRQWSINVTLNGVSTGVVECSKAVEVRISTRYHQLTLPLVVVQDGFIPACILLSMNYLVETEAIFDFG
ncbi:hypothetical protein Avbf_11941 [Armadillidium vulgare]|nr:hypothetical protein Avbf_11941 [Armadillidium vulgare]